MPCAGSWCQCGVGSWASTCTYAMMQISDIAISHDIVHRSWAGPISNSLRPAPPNIQYPGSRAAQYPISEYPVLWAEAGDPGRGV